MNQDSGSDESSDDDREPEESDETSGGGDVDQAVDGGGLEELPERLQSLHVKTALFNTILKCSRIEFCVCVLCQYGGFHNLMFALVIKSEKSNHIEWKQSN